MKLENLLFIDIETCPTHKSYEELHVSGLADAFYDKHIKRFDEKGDMSYDQLNEIFLTKSSLNAEYGKILTISIAILRKDGGTDEYKFHNLIKSSYNEIELLDWLKLMSDKYLKANSELVLCGHNIINFDIPFICKRFVINGIKIPDLFNVTGKKPWEIKHVDTMRLWQFGGSDFISLETICLIMGIESPKTTIKGSTFYKELCDNKITLDEVSQYCARDTMAVSKIIQKWNDLI